MREEKIVLTKNELCECISHIEQWLQVIREAINKSDTNTFDLGFISRLPSGPHYPSATDLGVCVLKTPQKMKKGKK